ncbi:MAG: mechanosensitive ion channel family protein [Cryomorphaceae bacterium]
MKTEDVQGYLDSGLDLVLTHGLNIVIALIILIIGLRIIKAITNGAGRAMEKRNVDDSLRPFLKTIISVVLKIMLVISVVSMVGIETTSFIAVLGAAGLAVGLALSGTLQNFAGGVIILLLKPFKVGDFIDAQGHMGTVNEIQIFHTILKTPDNKTVILPNGPVSTGSLTNFSTEPQRRVDMVFGIGYDDDIDKAKEIFNRLIKEETRGLAEPAPMVVLGELADSSVNFNVRLWANAGDYWGIYFDFHEKVKKTFDKEGVGIPFPQMDVHMHNEK